MRTRRRERTSTETPAPVPPLLSDVGPSSIEPLVRMFGTTWGAWGWSPSGTLAEKIGAVDRCLQLTAQQISTMPLRARGSADAPAWLSNPEPEFYTGITEAIFEVVWSRYARGNAYLYATSFYSDGFPASWIVLDPVTMVVDYDRDGNKRYRSNNYELDPANVLQVQRNPRAGQLAGTSCLAAYWSNLMSAWASEAYAADTLSHGGVPSSVLKWQNKLTAQQALDLQNQWMAAVANRQGAPAVLDQGLDYSVLAFSPKDLMLLELREFDTKAIASAFGVPAFLLNMPQADGLNYSNPQMLFDLWWRAELMPAAHQVEAALSQWRPRGNWVEFDPSIVLRPDLQTMTTVFLSLLAAGVVTKDEVRAAVLDLPPLSQGEALELLDEPPESGSPNALEVVA